MFKVYVLFLYVHSGVIAVQRFLIRTKFYLFFFFLTKKCIHTRIFLITKIKFFLENINYQKRLCIFARFVQGRIQLLISNFRVINLHCFVKYIRLRVVTSSRKLICEYIYVFSAAIQADDCLLMWNFFGNESQCSKRMKQRKVVHGDTTMNFKEFKYYDIRQNRGHKKENKSCLRFFMTRGKNIFHYSASLPPSPKFKSYIYLQHN